MSTCCTDWRRPAKAGTQQLTQLLLLIGLMWKVATGRISEDGELIPCHLHNAPVLTYSAPQAAMTSFASADWKTAFGVNFIGYANMLQHAARLLYCYRSANAVSKSCTL